MTTTKPDIAPIAGVQSVHQGRWLRVGREDRATLDRIRTETGADLTRASSASFTVDGDFSYVPVTFVDEAAGIYNAVRIVFAISRDRVISLEPSPAPAVLNTALTRMERDGRDSDEPLGIIADIFQAIADGTDGLVGQLNDVTERVMVETNAVLKSLEVKTRDFGVSDVASTQMDLAEMEELLSHCMESQLALVRAARHLRTRALAENPGMRIIFDTLIEDIDARRQLRWPVERQL